MDRTLLFVLFISFTAVLRHVSATSGEYANVTVDVRLVGGRYPTEGRVEVRLHGQETWGSYCAVEPPWRPAKLHAVGRALCRRLGHPAVYAVSNTAEFGRVTGPIRLQEIHCGDKRTRLEDCTLEPWTPRYDGCDHRHDVGIKCIAGELRLEGGRGETGGKVLLHLWGTEWAALYYVHYEEQNVIADYVCRYFGYPLAVAATREPIDSESRAVFCFYSYCESNSKSNAFYECFDEDQLKFCADEDITVNWLLGVACAREHEVLPLGASLEFRLSPHDTRWNGSRHVGLLEGRYNGSVWMTVCVHLKCLSGSGIGLVEQACRYSGYVRTRSLDMVPYTESEDASDRDELVLRVTYLYEKRWMYGEKSCREHKFAQIAIECDAGVTMYGLTVYPCPTQSCVKRCGRPATRTRCGCDVLCTLCSDCCHDYATRCHLQQQNVTEEFLLVASLHEFLSCVVVGVERAVLVQGCPTDWQNNETGLCGHDSMTEQEKYISETFFHDVHCTVCYYNESYIITTETIEYKYASDTHTTGHVTEYEESSSHDYNISQSEGGLDSSASYGSGLSSRSDSSYHSESGNTDYDSYDLGIDISQSEGGLDSSASYGSGLSSSSDSSYHSESGNTDYMSYDLGIDTCNGSNVSSEIQTGCRAYAAIVAASDGRTYKNPHCAFCNGLNISGWDFDCSPIYPGCTSVKPVHVLLYEPDVELVPEHSLEFALLSGVHCFSKKYVLRVQSSVSVHTAEMKDRNQSQASGTLQCYLLILSQQNVETAWPFYLEYVGGKGVSLLAGGLSEVFTWALYNVSGFEALLDETVLPHDEVGSSNKWVVRCGIARVDFDEVCGLVDDRIEPCGDSLFVTDEEMLQAFNFSGIQVVYVGGGLLVEAKWVSFTRSYYYQPKAQNTSAKSNAVNVCGEPFVNEECRVPLIQSTKRVSSGNATGVQYQRKVFLEEDVVYLPDDRILICSSIFTSVDPLDVIGYVSYSVSTVALVATFATYCVFGSLRNVPGQAIMTLTAALATAQLLTLAVSNITEPAGAFCVTTAALLHLIWLSTFAWTNVLSFDLVRTFSSQQTGRPNTRVFWSYSAYGWGVPLLIVATCLVIHFFWGERLDFRYGDGSGVGICWLSGRYAIEAAFVAPIACSLAANVVMFGWTVRSVHASVVAGAMARTHVDKSQTKEKIREIWIYLRIATIMGFTWVFGCLANRINHVVLWYFFVILNSLQGVFIFLSFGLNRRIRALWREKLVAKQPRRSSDTGRRSALSTSLEAKRSSTSV